METHPPTAASDHCLPLLSSPVAVPQPLPNVAPDHMQLQLDQPPSEDEMAAWLYQIGRGEEFSGVAQLPDGGSGAVGAGGQVAVDDWPKTATGSGERWTEGKLQSTEIMMEKLPTDHLEGTCCGACTGRRIESNSERKKTASRRSSQYAETHSLTEKRRRCKINEKLKTLQQLVPGCDKSNQASTLDQTIQYMKSLQQHVQAMSVGCCSTNPAAAVYAVLQPPPPYMLPAIAAGGAPAPVMVLRSTCPPMVQFAAPAVHPPLVHHPAAAAVVMMPTAALIQTIRQAAAVD
ncbi:hypothetical protein GUJ93_ZPchr0012g19128 [Zizania palustris]|uniref:BHLH domain-containing protein n=1 Tax=Zizania palustris TaxID=103762 RepID=A0A8J5WPX9_ZIZPA|nr:hypothetical protein GUJ93_ZPchr0012g19128 [Zizania palustris]